MTYSYSYSNDGSQFVNVNAISNCSDESDDEVEPIETNTTSCDDRHEGEFLFNLLKRALTISW
jgi:hypothetical protein